MEFGSEFVYQYDDVAYEYISDEEYEVGMNVSDSDSDDEIMCFASQEPGRERVGNAPDSTDSAMITTTEPPGNTDLSTVVPMSKQPSELDCEPSELYEEACPPSSPLPPLPPPPSAASRFLGGLFSKSTPPPAQDTPPVPAKVGRGGGKPKKKTHHWRSAPPLSSRESGSVYESLPHPIKPTQSRHGQRVRQGDTNIVSIKFNKLKAPSNMHAGDPETCQGCGAILSKISVVTMEGEQKIWTCEFCSEKNMVDIEDEEVPQDEDVTFMLEPALSTAASGVSGKDQSLVVFCVDVSGSMCVTTEVPGHVELRGGESLRRARQMNHERGDQYLPSQRRDVTYVSRLQSVQAAIDHQLNEMQKEYPNRRVALVTFCNEVTVIGDGKKDPTSIAGDKLGNKDTLKSIGTNHDLPDSIKNTRKSLGEKLFQLEEGGPTALGPALLVSTTLAAQVRGSKVILCTDGLANVGMGKLDNFKKDEKEEESLSFYEQVASDASEKGVSISVITIKGTDCKLVELGKMADKTGGQVNIVDPLKLTQEFSTILANQIIATNVVATVILHSGLHFLYEDSDDSKVVKNIGNVTEDSKITFEYGVRIKKQTEKGKVGGGKDEPDAMPTVMEVSQSVETKESNGDTGKMDQGGEAGETAGPSGSGVEQTAEPSVSEVGEDKKQEIPSELPFQLQIVYTDTEGAKALRLLTKTKPVTTDRRTAEKNCNISVLGTHTAQQSAQLAMDGLYTLSRQRALMNQRVAWRHTNQSEDGHRQNKTQYKNMFGKIKSMENYLNVRQKDERSSRGRTYSDSEDEEDEADAVYCDAQAKTSAGTAPAPKSRSFLSKLRKKKQRSETTGDVGAALVFKGKSSRYFDSDSD